MARPMMQRRLRVEQQLETIAAVADDRFLTADEGWRALRAVRSAGARGGPRRRGAT